MLQNKVILITGGTSQLGECFVRKALAEKATVFFTFNSAQEKAKELEALGAQGCQLDLASTEAIDAFVKDFKTKALRLDVLIHNAAAIRDKTISNLSEEDWDHVLNVDLKAPAMLTKKLMRLLFKAKPSKVFFITSRVGTQGGFGVSNYAAAKAGLIALTKSLAQELGKKKVLVNAVNPGFMKSAMTEDLPAEVIEKNMQANPLGEFSAPEEVASFLAYLCSPLMTQVTGQVFHFEGRKT